MAIINLNIRKQDFHFIKDYVKAGWAETNQEAVRHALLWFFWNVPECPPKGAQKKMSEAQLKRKIRKLCQNIVSAYRIACISREWIRGAKH